MPDINDINLREIINKATVEVFGTMLSMRVAPESNCSGAPETGNRIVGLVAFAGEIIGNVSIQADDEFSRLITAAMLGVDVSEVRKTEDISDVIGEIASMIGGHVKSRMSDSGLPCEMSFPSVTTGSDFKIEHMSWERHECFAFRFGEHCAYVEIRIKLAAAEKDEENGMDLISNVDIEGFIAQAANEVFDMMLSMRIDQCEEAEDTSGLGHRIVGAVSFTGDVTGNVSVQIGEPFGRLITANMLGLEPDEVDNPEEINDAVGELSNMIGGSLKSRFCDSGMPCELSIPSVTTGRDFKIENLGWTRHERYVFRHLDYTTLVEVCLKMEK